MSKGKRRRPPSLYADLLRPSAPQPPRRDDMYTITVHLLADRQATVARVTYSNIYDVSDPVTATGAAKRDPRDVHDPETARLLATSRALKSLATALRKQAGSRIRTADAIRRHHERIKQRGWPDPRPPRPGEVTFAFQVGALGMSTTPGAGAVISDGSGSPEQEAP